MMAHFITLWRLYTLRELGSGISLLNVLTAVLNKCIIYIVVFLQCVVYAYLISGLYIFLVSRSR